MPGMPDVIQKSPIMRRFELFSQNPDAGTLNKAINRLGGDKNLPDNQLLKIAEDLGFYDAAHPSTHFRQHWLGLPPNPDPFWPTIQQDVNDKIRAGMLKACQLLRDTGDPLEVWWAMSGAEGTTEFQVSVTNFGARILVIFHTPMVPCDEPLKDSRYTWIVTNDDMGNVVTRKAQVPQSAEPPEAPIQALRGPRKLVAKQPTRRPGPGPKKRKLARKTKPAKKRAGKSAKRKR